MTIDEAIIHARKVAECRDDMCEECRQEHEQLADWLEELKEYRKGFTEARQKNYETAYAKGFNDGCAKFSVGQDLEDAGCEVIDVSIK